MGIDRVGIVNIPKTSINKQIFIDRVRNDRGLEMIGSQNFPISNLKNILLFLLLLKLLNHWMTLKNYSTGLTEFYF